MKQILFILLAAISFNSQAQKKDCLLCGTGDYSINAVSPQNELYATLKNGSDTLEITISKGVHFIKIEGEVYEIQRKTELKKVEPQSGVMQTLPYYLTDPMPNYNAPMSGGNRAIINDSTTLYFENLNHASSKAKPKTKKK